MQSFSTTKDCIDGTVALVKERRNELATEFSLSNKQSSESLQQICEYFIQHNVHTVLLNPELCEQVPNRGKYDDIFELSIYDSYVTLLNQLKTYEGGVEVRTPFYRNVENFSMRKVLFHSLDS